MKQKLDLDLGLARIATRLDSAIASIAMADDPNAIYLAADRALFRIIGNTFFARVHPAIRSGTAALQVGVGDRPTKANLHYALDQIDESLNGWGEQLRPFIQAASENAYSKSRRDAWARAHGGGRRVRYDSARLGVRDLDVPRVVKAEIPTLSAFFDLQDEAAIEALANQNVYWIGQFYSDQLSDRIASVAETVILRSGLDRREAAKEFERVMASEFGYDPAEPLAREGGISVPIGWRGNAVEYFEMLAVEVVTKARVFGAVRSFHEAGIAVYEIIAVGDERTCDVCSYMDGKVFTTEAGMKQIDRTSKARSPGEIKHIHPWLKLPEIQKRTGVMGAGRVSGSDSRKLSAAGLSLPTYHGKCRCTVDVVEGASLEDYNMDEFLAEAS